MHAAVLASLLLAGCNQLLGVTDPRLHDGGITGNDAADAPGATTDVNLCPGDRFGYAISNVASCDIPPPTGSVILGNSTIDTTAGTFTTNGTVQPLPATAVVSQHAGGPSVRVVSVLGLRVSAGATVNVVGQYGLVVIAKADVMIEGSLAASANHATGAAGSRSAAACGASAGAPGTVGGGGGGMAISGCGGAGHGGPGGTGGTGGTVLGGVGGVADTDVALQPLLGGCPGGVRAGDAPASGGGAIQISSAGRIDITGTIAASGGGAVVVTTAAPAPAGASGGGVLLEAGSITMTSSAALTANGGAGADGSGTVAACAGENGHPRNAIPAAGGACTADLSGGAGGAGTTPAHGGDTGTRGTGGGGAVGRIAIHTHAFTPGIVSPPANVETF